VQQWAEWEESQLVALEEWRLTNALKLWHKAAERKNLVAVILAARMRDVRQSALRLIQGYAVHRARVRRDLKLANGFRVALCLRSCFEEWRRYDQERLWLQSFSIALATMKKAAAVSDWRNHASEMKWMGMVHRAWAHKLLLGSLLLWWKASGLWKSYRAVRLYEKQRMLRAAVATWSDNFTSVAYS